MRIPESPPKIPESPPINLLRGINIKGRKRHAYVAKRMPACLPRQLLSLLKLSHELWPPHSPPRILQTTTRQAPRALPPHRTTRVCSPVIPVATCDCSSSPRQLVWNAVPTHHLSWYVFRPFWMFKLIWRIKEGRLSIHATSCPYILSLILLS